MNIAKQSREIQESESQFVGSPGAERNRDAYPEVKWNQLQGASCGVSIDGVAKETRGEDDFLGDSSNGGGAKQSVKIKSSQRPSATSTTTSRRVLSSSVSRASPGCTDAFRSPIELVSPAVIISLSLWSTLSLCDAHLKISTERSRISRETSNSRELEVLDHPHLKTLPR